MSWRSRICSAELCWPAVAGWVLAWPAAASAITPDDPGPGDVRFTINSTSGTKPISPLIYGVNFYGNSGVSAPATLDRLGGNRWTGYNWENNFSNAGADYYHHNDTYLVGGANNTPPGEAIRPSLAAAAAADRALIVTVPMAGYVSADGNGTVDETQVAPSPRWKEVRAQKSSVYPGSSLSLTPDKTDGYVFTDELAHWVEATKSPSQQVLYSLDNEPALWGEALPAGWQSGIPGVLNPSSGGRTHPLIHPYAPTFAEMRDKTIAHAAAIKDVNPQAVVVGGVGYGYAEFTNLQGAGDATTSPSHPGGNQPGELNYLEWLLREVKTAETQQGRKLMDVLDVHWYPEATGGGTRIAFENSASPSAALIQARVQAPRSLWDASYAETSWITSCCSGGPIKLLKHLQRDVVDFNPGTKLAITEYNYGGGRHISGGIAQADVLGIFGQEGLYAAALWPLSNSANDNRFIDGAFKMYLNYDGAGGSFGDVALAASTNVIADSAVYASVDANDPSKVIVVAINRTASTKSAAIQVTHDQRLDVAEVYRLTSASSAPVRAADLTITLTNALTYSMPAYSVSTLVLRTLGAGDFDGDGIVDGGDLTLLTSHFGADAGAMFSHGDNDRDGDVDGADLLAWQQAVGANYGYAAASFQAAPEPSAGCTLLTTAIAAWARGVTRQGGGKRRVPLRGGRSQAPASTDRASFLPGQLHAG